MSDSAITFKNISKQYRLGLVSTRTLSHDLNRWWQTAVLRKEDPYLKIGETNDRSKKGESEYVWALRDIDFEVKQGEVLGIIGKNGAGKSTLLKILSRITTPTTGTIEAKGRIASLLEVGTGFHPELTGRENIYMNGSIMGMTRKEIARKLDEIVDFSGVERYLDTPVKRYSSGMTVRLGFSIAAHLEPEILVVDEVLAVGDAEFQKKAIGKMQDVSKGEGRTVLFVSHNMTAVNDLCKTAILLKEGSVFMTGNVKDVITEYLVEQTELSTFIEWSDDKNPGNDIVKVRKAYFMDENEMPINLVQTNEKFGVCVEYEILSDTRFFTHGLNVYNKMGVHIFTSHDNNKYFVNQQIKKGRYISIAWMPANFFQSDKLEFSFACIRYEPFEVLFHSKILSIDIVDTRSSESRPKLYGGVLPGIIRPILDWTDKKIN